MHRTATARPPRAKSLSHHRRFASVRFFSPAVRLAITSAPARSSPLFGPPAPPPSLWVSFPRSRLARRLPPLDHTMRGEVNVGGGELANRSAPPLPEASFGERQETRAALDASDQGGTLPHRPLYDSPRFGGRLVEAAGVTEGGAGILSARSVTVQDSLGDLGTSAALVPQWRDAGSFRRRRRRRAVPIYCSKAALDLFTRRLRRDRSLGR